MNKWSVPALGMAAMLAACASPEKVAAISVDPTPYAKLNCAQLADYGQTLDAAYEKGAKIEEDTKVQHAIAMAVSGLSTNRKVDAYIADVKGRQNAVHHAQAANNCNSQFAAK
jgi:hypothetical protein